MQLDYMDSTMGSSGLPTFTWRVDESARRWCRRGLWYAGVDLRGLAVSGARPSGGRSGQPWTASTYIYLTGAGRPPSSAVEGTSRVMRSDEYMRGTSVSDARLAGVAGFMAPPTESRDKIGSSYR